MVDSINKSSNIPEWLGNYPFHHSKKRPVVIKKGDEKALIFGRGGHLDSTPMYISTDRIFLGEYTVPPGDYFDPPDIHPGDECYFCLEGTAVIFDPVHGDAIELNEGDALLIPEGTWHVGFNFGSKNFRIIAIVAPKTWSDDKDGMGTDVVFKGKPVFYKGEE